VVRHAGRGRVSFRPANGARPGLEVHCCDDGPGPDFTEGPSSRGLGLGLATARELADSLAIRHEPGSGMCVRAVVLA
jgi:hypothetical protein